MKGTDNSAKKQFKHFKSPTQSYDDLLKTDRPFHRSTTSSFLVHFVAAAVLLLNLMSVDAKAKLDWKGKDGNDTEHEEEEEYFWGQDMELSPMVWIIIVSSVVCFWILLAAFLACFCGPNFLECYLCEQQVPRGQWTRVDHRETCAKDHERFLNGLQRVSLRCPRCLARLRKWPKLGSKTFKCRGGLACTKVPAMSKLAMSRKRFKKRINDEVNDKERNGEDEAMMPGGGPEPIEVENNGSNRLSCFLCDFNICDKCAEAIDGAESSNGSMGSNLTLPKSTKISKMVESVGGGNVMEKSRRITRESGNSVAWNDSPVLKTISRDIEMKQINTQSSSNNNSSSSNGVIKNGITPVRPK